ncbi:PDDEXK nuclease domain-containing protein [Flammeovirga sp. MY04]|uniref:PDDEXK nuclease domain-containing protein n=1 Tax=Flammeovirga sp. MY04 TaxID=1191459 RepID=UPI0008060DEE|nr:PDDEXK nuclease domain-containing protein [Flammeovirga sp. MY04]
MLVPTDFIKDLKKQILQSRYAVAKIANAEMLRLYFTVGELVEIEFQNNKWGAKVLEDISSKLQQEVPGLRGFSAENIKKMRRFFNEWNISPSIRSSLTTKLENKENVISSSLTTELSELDIKAFLSISFTHHFELLKLKDDKEKWYYIHKTAQNFWSVRHLRTEIKNQSHLQNELPNNFEQTMTQDLSNKALRSFKDQYLLDFVNVEDADDEIDERVLEGEIVQNIRKFLMSLGADFTFMGNQYRLVVEEDEYFIDLLFYHRSLQALVAFELKKGKFKPEYVGKMNFYLSALDDLVKQPHENPSIGIILC